MNTTPMTAEDKLQAIRDYIQQQEDGLLTRMEALKFIKVVAKK